MRKVTAERRANCTKQQGVHTVSVAAEVKQQVQQQDQERQHRRRRRREQQRAGAAGVTGRRAVARGGRTGEEKAAQANHATLGLPMVETWKTDFPRTTTPKGEKRQVIGRGRPTSEKGNDDGETGASWCTADAGGEKGGGQEGGRWGRWE